MSQARILVAEDEFIVAENARVTLQQLGFDVPSVVASGQDAVESAARLQPDLVLMDIQLAGRMDGVEAAALIRQRHGIPVVFLTAYSDEGTLQRAKRSDPFGFVLKPYNRLDLNGAIEMALCRSRMEATLRENEDLLRKVLDTIPVHVYVKDAQGRFVMANRAFSQETGSEASAMLGKSVMDFADADERRIQEARQIEQWDREVLRRGEPLHLPVKPFQRRDGGTRWLQITKMPLTIKGEPCVLGVAVDVSENERARAALQESEEKHRLLLENAGIGIGYYDLTGRILLLNKQALQHLQGRAEDFVGRSAVDVFGPDMGRRIVQRIRAAAESRRSSTFEDCIDLPSGRKCFRSTYSPILDARGAMAGVQILSDDITEVKQADALLRASEKRYHELFENMSSGVAVYEAVDEGRDFVFKDMNRAGQRISRVRKEDVIGRRLTEAFPAVGQIGLLDLLRRAWRTGLPGHGPVARYADGRTEPYWVENYVYHLPSGEIVALYDDVTERVEAEQRLRDQVAFLEALLEAIPSPVFYEDLRGVYQGCNQAFAGLILGLPKAQIVGKTLFDMPEQIPVELARIYGEQDLALLREPGTQQYEAQVQCADGVRRDFAFIKATYNDARGCTGGIVGIMLDISRHKQQEDDLRAGREQLRALAAQIEAVREQERASLARTIHDDFGHALAAMKMDVAWLSRRLADGDPQHHPAAVRERLETVNRHLDELIQAVRDAATELRPSALDDLGLAAAIEWEARQFQQRTGIPCRFDSSVAGVRFASDVSTALYRICQEMLANVAAHAAASEVQIRLERTGEHLALTVRDNGKGISQAEIESSRSLGILGMRERARILDGRLEIASVPGGGTAAAAYVPLATAACDPPANPMEVSR